MNTTPAAQTWWRPPSIWTAWDVFLVRVGASCIFFGALAHILPLFGLQLRKLNNLGNGAAVAGTAIGILGLAMIAYVVLLKGRVLKGLLIVAALMVIAFVGLLIISWFSSRRMSAPPGPPPFATGPSPGSFPTGAPTGPGFQPPSAAGRAGLAPPPPMDYDSLVTRFGKDRIIRIVLTNADGIDLGATVRKRIDAMNAKARPDIWRVSGSGDRGNLIAAPVGDLAKFIDALRLGDVVSIDQAERSAEINLDRTSAVPKRGKP